MRTHADAGDARGLPSRDFPWIKVCGVRTFDDIEWCARCGATHVGINAWPESPRFVAPAGRAALVAAAGRSGLVPVLVAPGAETLLEAGDAPTPAFIQLLSRPGDAGRAKLAEGGVGIVETQRVTAGRPPAPSWGDALLLDALAPGVPGGSGRTFDWTLVRSLAGPFILSGGLNPGNVAGAVSVCRPAGVDAASGLESGPGIKDRARIRDFCEAARAALGEIRDDS